MMFVTKLSKHSATQEFDFSVSNIFRANDKLVIACFSHNEYIFNKHRVSE